ncbi:glycoside hydrolase family 25 protein [Paenibacillus dauci]|uniref:glycoside hydrolase family 25 protein n=1 Tax=Paenibacillus dauci TaxID=1567106 RepID=UPI000619424C|nr:glycoside hydrolase family 25 protein [Paenibacillus dauci]
MQARSTRNAQGIDVSHWQGNINWNQVRAAGKQFVFIKASEGTSYRDDRFISNIQGARAAGMLVGAYHFLNAQNAAAARKEAAHFIDCLKKIGGADSLDLPPVMDYEDNPGKLGRSQINAVALAFLQEVERLSSCRPIVYTGNAFAAQFDRSLGEYDLWIARYSVTRVPDDCTAWQQWDFWQYTDAGQVPGIQGGVDLNEYQGTISELQTRYAKTHNNHQGDEKPMTAEEKKAFTALEATVKAQSDRIASLTDSRDMLKSSISKMDNRVQQIEHNRSMKIPEWAQDAVSKAVAAGIVDDPEGGSYDFYRLITVLYRKGII